MSEIEILGYEWRLSDPVIHFTDIALGSTGLLEEAKNPGVGFGEDDQEAEEIAHRLAALEQDEASPVTIARGLYAARAIALADGSYVMKAKPFVKFIGPLTSLDLLEVPEDSRHVYSPARVDIAEQSRRAAQEAAWQRSAYDRMAGVENQKRGYLF